MLRNYFSFIAVYKRITNAKQLKKLDPSDKRWILVKKRSWLPHKNKWLTTIYRGTFLEVKKGKVTCAVRGPNEVYKGFDGEELRLAERGIPAQVSGELSDKNTYIFLWHPEHRLEKDADKPVFTPKTLKLIFRYLW